MPAKTRKLIGNASAVDLSKYVTGPTGAFISRRTRTPGVYVGEMSGPPVSGTYYDDPKAKEGFIPPEKLGMFPADKGIMMLVDKYINDPSVMKHEEAHSVIPGSKIPAVMAPEITALAMKNKRVRKMLIPYMPGAPLESKDPQYLASEAVAYLMEDEKGSRDVIEKLRSSGFIPEAKELEKLAGGQK